LLSVTAFGFLVSQLNCCVKMTLSAGPPFRRSQFTRGWQIALTARVTSSQPFTPVVANSSIDRGEADRPDRVATGILTNPTPALWFDTKAFVPVPTGLFWGGDIGTQYSGRPRLCAGEHRILQSVPAQRTALFPATLGIIQFLLPNTNVDLTAGGAITSAYDARIMQFGLRYLF